MPGSIQVSVLDFKELPISSNSVKVSLGKVEHEALEKGTYSFPLTNLRDNLIISVEDSEGNQLSNSGVRTMSIIEKGTWDDLFPIEGGGLIHMKLEFILSDEERNRIRSMRETAMKKKQAEILASRLKYEESANFLTSSLSRHEVSDVLSSTSSQDLQRSGFNSDDAKYGLSSPLDDTSVKALESSDGNEESFQRQSFTNATDKEDESSSAHTTETIDQKETMVDTESRDSPTTLPNSSDNLVDKFYEKNLEEKTPSDVKTSSKETTSSPLLQEAINEIPLQQVVRKNLLEDVETRDFEKKNNTDTSKLLDNLVENLEKRNLEEKSPNVKRMSKDSKFPPFSQITEAKTIKNNEILIQEPDVPKKSSRSTIAEKIKSFSPKIAGEPEKQGSSEKTPRSIKNMISVFESSISQDRVSVKPLSTKSFRFGTSRLLKDNPVRNYNENAESSQDWLTSSKIPSSTRLRNSFSTGDLRKDLSSIITTEDQVGFGNEFIEPSKTYMQSNENDPKESEIDPKDSITVKRDLPSSPQESVHNEENSKSNEMKLLASGDEDATISGRMPLEDIKIDNGRESVGGKKTSKDDLGYFDHDGSGQGIFVDENGHFCTTGQGDCRIEGDQEKIVASIPDIVSEGESDATVKQENNADEEACNLSIGQAIKIALVVGFGVLVLLFRQRDSGKIKKKQNNVSLKNQAFMNKRGSFEEQRRKIGVLKLS